MNLGPHPVTSEQVSEHEWLVERFARRYDGVRGAELDDLEQEGRIAVWEVLTHDPKPSRPTLDNAISDNLSAWVRYVSREGMGGFDESLPDS